MSRQEDDAAFFCSTPNCPGCAKETAEYERLRRLIRTEIADANRGHLGGIIELMDDGLTVEQAIRRASKFAEGAA